MPCFEFLHTRTQAKSAKELGRHGQISEPTCNRGRDAPMACCSSVVMIRQPCGACTVLYGFADHRLRQAPVAQEPEDRLLTPRRTRVSRRGAPRRLPARLPCRCLLAADLCVKAQVVIPCGAAHRVAHFAAQDLLLVAHVCADLQPIKHIGRGIRGVMPGCI
jgi:hypothetical protein